MKILGTFLAFIILPVTLLISCQRTEADNSVSITISGGTTVFVKDANAVHKITVVASRPVKNPVTINLSSDAQNGEIVFVNSTLVIESGKTTASTDVIFPVDKLNANTPKTIIVMASTTSPGVKVEQETTSFVVQKSDINNIGSELSISSNITQISTTDGDGIASIMFVLSKPLDKPLEITWAYDSGLTVAKDGIVPLPTKMIIPAGEISSNHTITVRKGIFGVVPILFYVNNNSVEIGLNRLILRFTKDIFPGDPIALCPLISKYSGYAITKTFTVGGYTLVPEHNPSDIYGYTDLTGDITARVVDGSNISIQLQNVILSKGDPYLLAAWVDWNRNGDITEDEKVLDKRVSAPERGVAMSPYSIGLNIPNNTPYGRYFMRLGVYSDDPMFVGCGTIDNGDMMDITIDYVQEQPSLGVSIRGGEDEPIFVYDKDITKTFTVSIDRIADKPITLNLKVSSTGSDKPSLSLAQVTIPQGKASQSGTITFMADQSSMSQLQSLITVKIVSVVGAEIDKTADAITYNVNYVAGEDVDPVQLCGFHVLYSNNIFTESFTVGDYTLTPKHNAFDKGYGYADMSGNSDKYPEVIAKVKNGDIVSITYGNQDSRSIPYISVAWVDWNRDGELDDSERVLYREWVAYSDRLGQVLGTVSGVFNAPVGAKKGVYIMRIGSSLTKGITGGCGTVQNADMFDLKISYY